MHLCLDPFLNRLYLSTDIYGAFQVALVVKSPSANADLRHRYNSWVRKIPWRRKWQLTPVFLPGNSHGLQEPGRVQSMGLQRVGYN